MLADFVHPSKVVSKSDTLSRALIILNGVNGMNTLSWLLYLANVVGSLGILMSIGGFGLLFFALISAFISTISEYDGPFNKPPVWKPKIMIIGSILLLVSSFIPSSNTVYAIAASEMGEQALNTTTATKTFKALDAWLDNQLKP